MRSLSSTSVAIAQLVATRIFSCERRIGICAKCPCPCCLVIFVRMVWAGRGTKLSFLGRNPPRDHSWIAFRVSNSNMQLPRKTRQNRDRKG